MIETPIHEFPDMGASAQPITFGPKTLPRVFIGLCSRDWQTEIHTSESVRFIGQRAKCEVIFPSYMLNDGVARARNNLTANFLQSDATHLLFLDNDIIIEPRHVDLLLAHDKGIVCGMYPKKQPILDWVANYLPGEKPDENGLIKLRHAGTGCMLIKREVIEDVIAKLKDRIEYRGDPGPETVRWDLFPMHADKGVYKSEDWFFCERAQECGHVVWSDTTVQLRHVGKCVYPLQFTLTDDEVVDIIYHRYSLWPDHVKTFIASGEKSPGLMGGHRERFVRLWPKDFPVEDLHQGGILGGSFDVPVGTGPADAAPTIIDLGAGCGAFARFSAKRWPGCKIVSYEGGEMFEWLQKTATSIKSSAVTTVGTSIDGANAHDIPVGNVLKIDLPGKERDILSALHGANRIEDFEAIVVAYGNDMEAFFISKLLEATHALHCWQRFGDNRGVQKFINRKTKVGIQAARDAA